MANCQQLSGTTCRGGRAASTVFIPPYAARRYKQEAATARTPKFAVNSNPAMGMATATLMAQVVRRATRRAICSSSLFSSNAIFSSATEEESSTVAKWKGGKKGRPPALPAASPVEGVQPGFRQDRLCWLRRMA